MKNFLTLLLSITVFASCKKEDIKPFPKDNVYNIEIVYGSNFFIESSDTSFIFASQLNNQAIVKGNGLIIQNLSNSNSQLKVNGIEFMLLKKESVNFDKWRAKNGL